MGFLRLPALVLAAAATFPPTSLLPAAAAGATPAGWLESLITPAVVALITGVLSAYVTSRVLSVRFDGLAKMVDELRKQQNKHAEEMARLAAQAAQVDRERLACELRSARCYATHVEVAQVINEQGAQFDAVSTKIGVVHKRVDDLVRDMGLVLGYMKARPPSGPALPDHFDKYPAAEGAPHVS